MKTFIIPALAVTFALASPALAQTQDEMPMGNRPQSTAGAASQEGSSSATKSKALLTINKLKQDLQKAGFSDVQVLADSFVVQAKDKEGNPTVMTLSPGGVFAISAISEGNRQKEANARTGSSPSEGTTSGPANSSNVSPSRGEGVAGQPGTPGLPGNKSGPAERPNSR